MVGLDQSLPWHHQLHLREKILPFDLLLGRGELAILEAELVLQPISPVLACDDDVIVAWMTWAFQSLLRPPWPETHERAKIIWVWHGIIIYKRDESTLRRIHSSIARCC
jgi:hypothetical protein